MTFSDSTGSVTLPQCNTFLPPSYTGLFNNPDGSYKTMYVGTPPAGSVYVVSGKAPTTPPTNSPSTLKTQVRYWSLCSYGRYPYPAIGCSYDLNTPLQNGSYHVVFGTPDQEAAIQAVPGAKYVPRSDASGQATQIMLRNLLGDFTTVYPPTLKTCRVATLASCIK
jgi:hypothetical protein